MGKRLSFLKKRKTLPLPWFPSRNDLSYENVIATLIIIIYKESITIRYGLGEMYKTRFSYYSKRSELL